MPDPLTPGGGQHVHRADAGGADAHADPLVVRLRAAGSVFAEDEAALLRRAASDDEELVRLADRRVAGEPLEQVLGFAEFAGRRIVLEPGVFVPRRRTELLAELAAARLPPGGVAVELCCGAGAVAAVLTDAVPGAEVHAADVDPAAVRAARRNLEPRGVQVHEGDLHAALPGALRGRVDVLAANAPYVPTRELGTMPREARLHEPSIALDGGPDGLDVQRRVVAGAPAWLAPGGVLLVETSAAQAQASAALVTAAGLQPRVVHDAERDATVVLGRMQARVLGTAGSVVGAPPLH